MIYVYKVLSLFWIIDLKYSNEIIFTNNILAVQKAINDSYLKHIISYYL